MSFLNRYMDAAVLKPEFTQTEAKAAIEACVEVEAFSVCVRPCDIDLAKSLCSGTQTAVGVVLGFPHGDGLSESKAAEAALYIEKGVDEIDMVANFGLIKSGAWDAVKADIEAVAKQTKAAGIVMKVIFETAHLDADQIRKTVEICIEAGADFVKTSTGFNGQGAQEDDVKLMLETAGDRIKVKPSGGIRDAERAQMFVDMGVHRLGLGWDSCVAIEKGSSVDKGGY